MISRVRGLKNPLNNRPLIDQIVEIDNILWIIGKNKDNAICGYRTLLYSQIESEEDIAEGFEYYPDIVANENESGNETTPSENDEKETQIHEQKPALQRRKGNRPLSRISPMFEKRTDKTKLAPKIRTIQTPIEAEKKPVETRKTNTFGFFKRKQQAMRKYEKPH